MNSTTETAPAIILRDYQIAAIEQARQAYAAGHQGVMLVSPTSSGKTVMFCDIIRGACAKGKKSIVLAHRGELLDQAADKLSRFGIPHGIIQASRNTNPTASVQVCSIDTMAAWIRRGKQIPFIPDFVIYDEGHLAVANRYKNFLAMCPKAKRLLVTATPTRADGKGFTEFASNMIEVANIAELIDAGYIVPPENYTADISLAALASVKVKKSTGDFDEKQLDAAVNTKVIVGNIVQQFSQIAPDRQTVAFCVGIQHSKNLTAEFVQAGYRAEHLDGTMPKHQRKAILARLEHGETQIVCNANVLCEGWDQPSVSCVILARPTKSEGLYLQQVGRGLRLHPGKTECIIMDCGGNIKRFGCATEPRSWTLEGKPKPQRKKKEATEEIKRIMCELCLEWTENRLICDQCGMPIPSQQIEVQELDLQLQKVDSHWLKVRQEYARLRELAKDKKTFAGKPYKPSWAWFQMRGETSEEELLKNLGVGRAPYPIQQRIRELGGIDAYITSLKEQEEMRELLKQEEGKSDE